MPTRRRGRVTEGEGIQHPAGEGERHADDEHGAARDQHGLPAGAGEGSEQPGQHLAVGVAGRDPEDHERRDGGGERRHRDAGEHRAGRGDAAERSREGEGRAEGEQRAGERGERQEDRRPEQQHGDRTERGAG